MSGHEACALRRVDGLLFLCLVLLGEVSSENHSVWLGVGVAVTRAKLGTARQFQALPSHHCHSVPGTS